MFFFQLLSFGLLLFQNAIEFIVLFLEMQSFHFILKSLISEVIVFRFFLIKFIFIGRKGIIELKDLVIFSLKDNHFLL